MENEPDKSGFWRQVGLLRLLLTLIVVLCAGMVFFAGLEPHGWRAIPVYVAPVMAILLAWGLLFDMLMGRVFMAEKPEKDQTRYRTILRLDGALFALLLITWGPYFYGLLNR